ncbi:hypothetical protein Tco_1403088 [Tanacetum coccineum]
MACGQRCRQCAGGERHYGDTDQLMSEDKELTYVGDEGAVENLGLGGKNSLSPVESCQKDMVLLRIEETWMIVLDTVELRRLTLVPKDHYLVDRIFSIINSGSHYMHLMLL